MSKINTKRERGRGEIKREREGEERSRERERERESGVGYYLVGSSRAKWRANSGKPFSCKYDMMACPISVELFTKFIT